MLSGDNAAVQLLYETLDSSGPTYCWNVWKADQQNHSVPRVSQVWLV